MIRQRLSGAILAVTLLAGLSGEALAQDPAPAPAEGLDWILTAYWDEETAELTAVPIGLGATLRLEEGLATGSTGCNDFDGSYQLDGTSLSLGEELRVTLAPCEEPALSVEDAYLAALGQVDGWTIDGDVLELADGFGDVSLAFERPATVWTTSQVDALLDAVSALQAELAALRADVEALGATDAADAIGPLRQRVRALEKEDRKLGERLAAIEQEPLLDPPARTEAGQGSSTFSAAESVLLGGIPSRIASRCQPLRSSLPRGTRAAVSCTPSTAAVTRVDYYLMEGEDAATAFGADMSAHKVREATSGNKTCEQGVKSQRHWLGNGWQAEGCYRASDLGQLRFIDNATQCRKLKVGGATLASPTVYVALQGSDMNVARAHGWATKGLADDAAQLTSITRPIPSGLGRASSCPA